MTHTEITKVTNSATKSTTPSIFNVIFYNDDKTSFEFVMAVLHEIYGKSYEQGFEIASIIHETGKEIAGTYIHEVAEQKKDETIKLARANGFPLCVTLEESN